MALTFERDKGYERVPPFYRELADSYLINKTFNSFSEALDAQRHKSHFLSEYFSVQPVSVHPKTLPEILTEAEIKVIIREEGTGIILSSAPEGFIPILKAKVVE